MLVYDIYVNGLNEYLNVYEFVKMVVVCVMEFDMEDKDLYLNKFVEMMFNMEIVEMWGLLFII